MRDLALHRQSLHQQMGISIAGDCGYRSRMADRHVARLVVRIVAALLLVVIGCLGAYNAISEWDELETLLQRSVMMGSALYFAAGLIGGLGVLLGRRWGIIFAVIWGVIVTYTGTTAVLAYDPSSTLASVAGAFLMCVVITGIVVWLAKFGTKTILRPD